MDENESCAKSAADEKTTLPSIGKAGKAPRHVIDEPPTPEGQSPVTTKVDTSPAPRPTSARQIEANRRNALHSTGPTTPKGKQVSRFNALKHGSRAKELIIPGQEDPAEFEAILRELCEDWEPEGHTELYLVEQIALAEWRLRRVQRAELGEIRGQTARRMASEAREVEEKIELAFHHFPERLPQILGKSTAGIAYLQGAIEHALDELESQGTVSERTRNYLKLVFGTETDSPVTMLAASFLEETREKKNEGNLESDGKSRLRRTRAKKRAVRKHLQVTLLNLERRERKLRKQETTALEIIQQKLSIAEGPELERHVRYETAIKRDLHRTIDLLERLQRRRRGEPTLPTLNVNLSRDD
jgi:hypothetical protein